MLSIHSISKWDIRGPRNVKGAGKRGSAILSETPPSARSKDWNPRVSPAPNRQNIIILEWLRDSLILGWKVEDWRISRQGKRSWLRIANSMSFWRQRYKQICLSPNFKTKKNRKIFRMPSFFWDFSTGWFTECCAEVFDKVTIYPTAGGKSDVTLHCLRQMSFLSFL